MRVLRAHHHTGKRSGFAPPVRTLRVLELGCGFVRPGAGLSLAPQQVVAQRRRQPLLALFALGRAC